jgi:hypothetical protein
LKLLVEIGLLVLITLLPGSLRRRRTGPIFYKDFFGAG